MKRRAICFLLVLCSLLCGCSWLEGNYHNVTPHRVKTENAQVEAVSASNYRQLCDALEEMIETGTESSVINVSAYNQSLLENGIEMAASYAVSDFPIGVYAVEALHYELGTNSGKPAIAVDISYRHSRVEIQKIRRVKDIVEAQIYLEQALEDCDSGIVMLIDAYTPVDFTQIVENYAAANPQIVMEIPQVSAGIYPEGTGTRVVELTFTYHTSRDILRQMQTQVDPVFDSAALYVTGDGEDSQKLTQLYAFLMERFDYQVETSITPTYSLLCHGVGDSRAFASVYASMCHRAGLECVTVTGTRSGEPWCWNIVKDGDNHFHVDLLRCSEEGGFRKYTDADMSGYVWDYSAYPECPKVYVVQQEQETAPSENPEDPEATDSTQSTEPVEDTTPSEPEENLE